MDLSLDIDSNNLLLINQQETDRDLLVNVQESTAEVWVGGGLLQGWGHRVQQWLHGTF